MYREMTYLVRTVHIKAPWGSAPRAETTRAPRHRSKCRAAGKLRPWEHGRKKLENSRKHLLSLH